MAKRFEDYETEEFFIKKTEEIVEAPTQAVNEIKGEDEVPTVVLEQPPVPDEPKTAVEQPAVSAEPKAAVEQPIYSPTAFEESLARYSSANVPKRGKKKKRKLGTAGIVRMLALCICLGVFMYSFSNILARSSEDALRDEAYSFGGSNASVVPSVNGIRDYGSMDLHTLLGSDKGIIERFDSLDKNVQDYYVDLHAEFRTKKAESADPDDCWAYIACNELDKSYPIMKGKDNDEYLYRRYDGTADKGGAIFADSALEDDYEKNKNIVLYGHCMTDGSMFRGVKLFFDSANRYSKAQNLEITVVTESAVYVYEFFSGYRAEGDAFTRCYTTNTKGSAFYDYLKGLRALNTINRDVSYDENSKIITLVTCTNLSYKPAERYVLHGILKATYYF